MNDTKSEQFKQPININFSELLFTALTRGHKPFNWTDDNLLLSRFKNTCKNMGISLDQTIEAGIEQAKKYSIVGKYNIISSDEYYSRKSILINPSNTKNKFTIGGYKYTNKCSICITIKSCGDIYVTILKYNEKCLEILKHLGPINVEFTSNTQIDSGLMYLQLPDNIINLKICKHNLKIFKFPKYLQIFSNHSYIANNFINILPETLKVLNTTNTLEYLQRFCNYPPNLEVFIYTGYAWCPGRSRDSEITNEQHLKFINDNNIIRMENLPFRLKKAYFNCQLEYNQNLFPPTLEELYVTTLLYDNFVLLPNNLQIFYIEEDLLYVPELLSLNFFDSSENEEYNYIKKKYLQINTNLKKLLFNVQYDLFNMVLNTNLPDKLQIIIIINDDFNDDDYFNNYEKLDKTIKELNTIYNTIEFRSEHIRDIWYGKLPITI